MTNASAETFAKPTPALIDGATPEVSQSILTDTEIPLASAFITPLDAYNLANEGDAAEKAFLDLIQARHAMGRRYSEKLAVSMQALAAVKTPREFSELQRSLLTEAMTDAVNDCETIAKLTAAAFSTAFNPVRMKVGDLLNGETRQE